ncbi:hypothetical protein [Arthrobacter sp. UYCu712]|uniref:DUF7793 family protein n=1 Tax=Arthrobacter sp. UYCu712 TaxID=3156340 RepID=UPI003394FE6F
MTVDTLAAPDERLPDGATASPSAATAVITGATASVPDSEEPAAGAGAPIGVHQLDGGIIQVTLPPNEEIAGAEARIAGATVRALADGRRVPVLLVITGVVGVSIEARHVYASSIAASAFALVGESPVDRVIAHYLLRSKTETIPAQFFTSEAEAAEWLGQYTSED